MRFGVILVCAFALVAASGCKSGVSESDMQQVNKNFSRDSYEKAMKDAGRGKELEEEKAKEAAYKATSGSNSADQDAGQH